MGLEERKPFGTEKNSAIFGQEYVRQVSGGFVPDGLAQVGQQSEHGWGTPRIRLHVKNPRETSQVAFRPAIMPAFFSQFLPEIGGERRSTEVSSPFVSKAKMDLGVANQQV